jgi:hypothetical protein
MYVLFVFLSTRACSDRVFLSSRPLSRVLFFSSPLTLPLLASVTCSLPHRPLNQPSMTPFCCTSPFPVDFTATPPRSNTAKASTSGTSRGCRRYAELGPRSGEVKRSPTTSHRLVFSPLPPTCFSFPAVLTNVFPQVNRAGLAQRRRTRFGGIRLAPVRRLLFGRNFRIFSFPLFADTFVLKTGR